MLIGVVTGAPVVLTYLGVLASGGRECGGGGVVIVRWEVEDLLLQRVGVDGVPLTALERGIGSWREHLLGGRLPACHRDLVHDDVDLRVVLERAHVLCEA